MDILLWSIFSSPLNFIRENIITSPTKIKANTMNMQTLAPVQQQERETLMDVLRGFAILGIFIANLNGFSWYSDASKNTGPFLLPELDHQMSFLHHMFIEGKFYSIFSLLFGWGIALQFKRASEKGLDALPIVKRRLMFMLLLGALHLLIWPGDIVFFYALLGFILIPLRKLSNKTMLITGAVLILSPILLYAAKSHWMWLNAPAGILEQTAAQVHAKLTNRGSSIEEVASYLKETDWLGVFKTNISGFFYRYAYLFFVSRIPKVLGMFLIGYFIGKSEFYKNIQQQKKKLYIIIALGILIGLPANYYLAYYMTYHMGDYWTMAPNGLYQTIAYALGVAPLALVYVAIFMLIYQTTIGKKLLSAFAPVGKMAFSNYIFQSLVGSFVFLGAGLGYIGMVGPVYYTIFGVSVFIFQMVFSHIWLSYFNYGPLEWLWRSATYKKLQPLRIR